MEALDPDAREHRSRLSTDVDIGTSKPRLLRAAFKQGPAKPALLNTLFQDPLAHATGLLGLHLGTLHRTTVEQQEQLQRLELLALLQAPVPAPLHLSSPAVLPPLSHQVADLPALPSLSLKHDLMISKAENVASAGSWLKEPQASLGFPPPRQPPASPPQHAGQQQQQQQQQDPPDGGAVASVAAPAAGATAGQQPTRRQLLARAAQARYMKRKKERMKDTAGSLEAFGAAVEQEQAAAERLRLTAAMYEHMVEYKEEMLCALQAAQQLIPDPGIVIPEAMAEVVQRLQLTKTYDPDVLMRYAPGGYTDHLDATGRIKEATPFEAVARDWTEIAEGLQQMLAEAHMGSKTGPSAAAPSQRERAARFSAAGETEEAHSLRGPASGSSWREVGNTASVTGTPGNARRQQQQHHQRQEASGRATQEASIGSSSSSVERPPGLPSEARRPVGIADAAAAAGGSAMEGPGASSVAPELWRQPSEEYIRKALSSGTVGWEQMARGAELWDGEDMYCFTGPQMQRIGGLLHRVGALSWQQGLLFPENANRMMCMSMDGRAEVCKGEEDLPRWRAILRQLRLCPAQLEALVAVHSEYLAMVRPALEERRPVLHALRQLRLEAQSTSQQGLYRLSLDVQECNTALIRSVQAQYAATAFLAAGLFRLLDFPLQQAKVVALSYPYYPQIHLLGLAAAVELGLDMHVYDAFHTLSASKPDGGAGSREGCPAKWQGSGGLSFRPG